jgi:hypothetical protein
MSDTCVAGMTKELLEALMLAKLGLEAHLEHYKGHEGYTLFFSTSIALDKINQVIAKAEGE